MKLRVWSVSLGLVLCALLLVVLAFRPFNFNSFLNRSFYLYLLDDPELLTRTGILPGWVPRWYNASLTEVSPGFLKSKQEWANTTLHGLESFERNELGPDDQLSFDIMRWFLNNAVGAKPFLYHASPITPLNGPHIELPAFMARVHPLNSKSDCERFVARLAQFPQKMTGVIDVMEAARDQGIIPSAFIIDKLIEQCEDQASRPVDDHQLLKTFDARTADIGLTPAQRNEFLAKVRLEINNAVRPAYARLAGYLRQLRTRAIMVAGVWNLPNGDAYYLHQLKHHCTMAINPDSLYAVAQVHLATLNIELADATKAGGFSSKDGVSGLFSGLNSLQPITKPDTLVLGDMKALIDRATQNAASIIGQEFSYPVMLNLVPEAKKGTSPTATYVAAEPAAARHAQLIVDVEALRLAGAFTLKATVFHEAVPGHHLQKSWQRNLGQGPIFRRYIPFAAYTEGWAMYAERLADELGWYGTAPDRIGMIRADLLRTARLMADIGIHKKRWLHDQAVQFFIETVGLTTKEATTEVDRIVAWPGHGCAYKVGEMFIWKLRRDLESELGSRFSLPAFHLSVIDGGAMPLEVLAAKVRRDLVQ